MEKTIEEDQEHKYLTSTSRITHTRIETQWMQLLNHLCQQLTLKEYLGGGGERKYWEKKTEQRGQQENNGFQTQTNQAKFSSTYH